MMLDVPNTYIQTDIPEQKVGEQIVMKVRGELVDWLCQKDLVGYLPYVVVKRGIRVLYLSVTKYLRHVTSRPALVQKALYQFGGAGLYFQQLRSLRS